jgi:hypothetical protein
MDRILYEHVELNEPVELTELELGEVTGGRLSPDRVLARLTMLPANGANAVPSGPVNIDNSVHVDVVIYN